MLNLGSGERKAATRRRVREGVDRGGRRARAPFIGESLCRIETPVQIDGSTARTHVIAGPSRRVLQLRMVA
jgi:hypothetical protein